MKSSVKCAIASSMALFTVVAGAGTVALSVDKVQQRYPWSGLVDIDYTISCDSGTALGLDDNLEVLMIDNSETPAVTNRALTFLQAPLPMTPGSHRITWNANADGVSNRTDRAQFEMTVVHYAEEYMVIDVKEGASATEYHVTYLNGKPGGDGFNQDEYKGDKIVLRRIRPGSYVAGSPSTEAQRGAGEIQHNVMISKPFYIGVFEITQKQYYNVMAADPSAAKGDYRPVEQVSYQKFRGTNDWPGVKEPTEESFVGQLLAKCVSQNPATGAWDVPVTGFDMPTEFQWEYACRAGTTNGINTAVAFDNTSPGAMEDALKPLARFKKTKGDGKGEYSEGHTKVGSYEPNAWGLYDMHGNVWELCRDWYSDRPDLSGQFVDPEGPLTGPYRLRRGGSWDSQYYDCRSAKRDGNGPTESRNFLGHRLCCETR